MLLLVASDPRWLSFSLFADVLPIRTDVHLAIGTAHLCPNGQHHEIFKVGSNPVRSTGFHKRIARRKKVLLRSSKARPKSICTLGGNLNAKCEFF
jgi:hypothetical protein